MAKLQIIAEIAPNLPFSEFNFYDPSRSTFELSAKNVYLQQHIRGAAPVVSGGAENIPTT